MAYVIPGLGYKSKLLIGRETVAGTNPAAADAGMEILGATITPKLSVIEDPSMSSAQVSRRFIGQGGQSYECSFRFRVGFEGLLSLLRAFFPTYSHALADSTAHDHTFKEGVNPFSYSLDFIWGGAMGGNAIRLSYAFGQNLRIGGQVGTGEGAMLTGEATFVAKTLTENVTPMTGGALPTALGVIFHQALTSSTNLKDGSGNASNAIQLKSFEFSCQNPFDTERYLFGQVNAETPVRNGPTDATLQFEEEFADAALLTAAKGNTATALMLLFQHPTVIGATTAKREFEIKANEPTAAEYSTEVPGWGVVTQRASFRLAYDTTDASFVVIRVRSTEAQMSY